jgi:hypothetical protein
MSETNVNDEMMTGRRMEEKYMLRRTGIFFFTINYVAQIKYFTN